MFKNKLNLSYLLVAFCFFGCGNIDGGSLKNLIENVDKEKLVYPTNSSDQNKFFSTFRHNVDLEFRIKRESEKQREQGRKEYQKNQKERKNIDYLQIFADAVSIEVNKIPQGCIPTFPSDIQSFLKEDIFDQRGNFTSEVSLNTLEFALASKAIELVFLFQDRYDEIIKAFYKTYNDVFENTIGLKIDLYRMCADENQYYQDISLPLKSGHKTFRIIMESVINAIERYALFQRCINSDQDATLWQIFHGIGTSKDLRNSKDKAYEYFLKTIKDRIDKALGIIKTHLSPLVSISNLDITQSKKATLRSLKELIDNEKSLISFSNIFELRSSQVFFIQNNPAITMVGNQITLNGKFKDDPQIQRCIRLISDITSDKKIDMLNILENAAKKVNQDFAKELKKNPNKKLWDVPVPTVKK